MIRVVILRYVDKQIPAVSIWRAEIDARAGPVGHLTYRQRQAASGGSIGAWGEDWNRVTRIGWDRCNDGEDTRCSAIEKADGSCLYVASSASQCSTVTGATTTESVLIAGLHALYQAGSRDGCGLTWAGVKAAVIGVVASA